MERPIRKDPIFLAQKAEPATADDLETARDLLDTLIAHREGCLSLPGTRKAKRYRSVKVRYQNERMQVRLKTFTGWTAQVIQHELDHFPAIVFCAAITLMLLSAVAVIQDKKFFSSAPKEAQEVIKPRTKELFYYPEVGSVYPLKKYGFNIKSQLLKLLVIFPAVSALAAWICALL